MSGCLRVRGPVPSLPDTLADSEQAVWSAMGAVLVEPVQRASLGWGAVVCLAGVVTHPQQRGIGQPTGSAVQAVRSRRYPVFSGDPPPANSNALFQEPPAKAPSGGKHHCPVSTWSMRHHRKALGNETLAEEQQAEASGRVTRMAEALSHENTGQLRGTRCAHAVQKGVPWVQQ